MTFSFFANKKFTFKDSSKNSKSQIAKFLIITTIGIWIIQPLIIEGSKLIATLSGVDINVMIFIGKVLASGVSMVWNYLLYRKFVFTKGTEWNISLSMHG